MDTIASAAFASSATAGADGLRLLLLLAVSVTGGLVVRNLASGRLGARGGLVVLAAALFAAPVISTELLNFGAPLSWHVWAVVVGVGALTAGLTVPFIESPVISVKRR